jgi:xanthine dehydrogenase FAD-binding subunit
MNTRTTPAAPSATAGRYIAARSLEEAAEAAAAGDATILAGGTDLMVQVNAGLRRFDGTVISISRIDGIKGITRENDKIIIGALATVSDILEDGIIAETADVLRATADCFASNQIRNAATIGGNICNASPAGDMIVPLLLLDARLTLVRWADGRLAMRRVKLDGFFTGPGRTIMETGEILSHIAFDAPAPGFVAGFLKSGPRPALEISVVSVGLAGQWRDGALGGVRVAFGSVAPTPIRGPATEAAIDGRALDDAVIAAAAAAAAAEITPITDIRASAWYRRNLARVFTERLLTDVVRNSD